MSVNYVNRVGISQPSMPVITLAEAVRQSLNY